MSFDGAIYAMIGADTKDYEKAMNDVVSSTKKAFDEATKTASQSGSQMVQQIGKLMNELASNSGSLGSKVGQGLTGGVKIAMGELQRITANIGAKIPEPIRLGFQRLAANVKSFIGVMGADIASMGNKVNAGFKKAFDFDISKAIQSPKGALVEIANSVDTMAQRISSRVHAIGSVFANSARNMPGPYKTAFNNIANSLAGFEARIQLVGGKVTSALGQGVLNPINSSWSSLFSSLNAKVDGFVNKVSSSMTGRLLSASNTLGTSISGKLGGAFTTMGQKATGVLSRISNKFANTASAGEKLTGTIRNIVSAFSLMAVASKVLNTIKNAIGGAVDRVDTLNKFPKMMESWGYSADQSKQAIDKLSKGIDGLPTALDEVAATAQQLTLLTGDLGKSTDLTLALNNAFLASGSSAADASRGLIQFSQMLSNGKVDMQSWRTLMETMPVGLQKTAEAFGFTGAAAKNQLYSALKEGDITFEQFSDKLIELNDGVNGFAELARINSIGIRTSFKNIGTAVTKGVANMIQAWDEASKAKGLPTIVQTLDKVKAGVNSTFGYINTMIPNIVGSLAQLSKMFKFDTSGLNVVKTIFDQVNQALKEFSETGSVSSSTMDKLKSSVVSVGTAAVSAWALMNPSSAIATIMPLTGAIGKVGGAFGSLGAKAASSGSLLNRVFNGYTETVIENGEKIKKTHNGISQGISTIASKFSGLPGVMGSAASTGTSVLGTMVSGITSIAGIALASIGPAAILGLVVAGLGLINSQFGTQISQLLSIATTQGPAIIMGLVSGITSQIPALIASGAQLISQFANSFATLFPVLVQAGVQLITSLVQGVGQNASSLISSAITIVGSFVDSVLSALPQLLSLGMEFLANVVQGIVTNIPQLMSTAQQILTNFISSLSANMPNVLAKGIEILQNLINGAVQMLPGLISMAGQAMIAFIRGIVSALPQLLQGGIQMIVSLVQGIINNLPQMVSTGMQVLSEWISGLLRAIPQIIMAGIQLVVQLAAALIMGLPKILEAGWNLIKGLGQAMLEAIPAAIGGVAEAVGNFFGGIWDWVTGKNDEGSAKTKATMDDMTSHVSAKTAEASASAKQNTSDMAMGISGNMDTLNNDTLAKLGILNTNVDAGMQGLVTSTGINMAALNSNVNTAFTQANTDATTQTAQMQQNVSTNTALMGTEVLNQATTMANGVSTTMTNLNLDTLTKATAINTDITTNFTQAQVNATSQTQQLATNTNAAMNEAQAYATTESANMSTNVTANVSALNTNASAQLQALQGTANNSLASVQSVATTNASTANANVTSNFNQMQVGATSATTNMAAGVNSNLNQVASNAQSSTSQVASTVTQNFNQADQAVKTAMNNMSNSAKTGMNQVTSAVKSGGQQMTSTFNSTFNQVKSTVTSGMSATTNAVRNGMNNAVNAARSANQQIVSAFQTLAGQLQSAGYNAGMGLYGGLASTAGSLYSLAASIANNIASTIRRALDIHSPSRVMKAIGGFTGEGMYLGMESWVRDIKGVAKEYAMAITDQDYQTNSVLTTSASVTGGGVSTALDNLSEEVKNTKLSDPQFEVHNEIVGDEIYTTIKEKDARHRSLDEYFVYE